MPSLLYGQWWSFALVLLMLAGGRLFAQEQPAAGKAPVRLDASGDPLPSGAIARIGTLRLRHSGEVTAVAFAPDGKTLASGGTDERVRLWDVATGKLLREIKLGGGAIGVGYSADGSRFFAADYSEGAQVWDT